MPSHDLTNCLEVCMYFSGMVVLDLYDAVSFQDDLQHFTCVLGIKLSLFELTAYIRHKEDTVPMV